MKLLLPLFLFTATLAAAQTPDKTWLPIKEGNISALYPPNWELRLGGLSGTTFMVLSPTDSPDDDFRENVNLIAQDLKMRQIDLDSFVEISKKQVLEYFESPKILYSERVSRAKLPFHKISYTAYEAGFNLHFEQYYWILENKAYVLTFTAEDDEFEKYKTLGRAIMDTVKLVQ